jgi:hypothetical protein
MVRTVFKVLVVDALLLIALFFVIQDLDWRTSYAASLHGACFPNLCGYSPSFSYNVLVQFFTMSGNGVSLTSPPTLDWVQVLAFILVAINAWFVYATLSRKRATQPGSPPGQTAASS